MNSRACRSILAGFPLMALCVWLAGCAHRHRVEPPVAVVHHPVPPPAPVPPPQFVVENPLPAEAAFTGSVQNEGTLPVLEERVDVLNVPDVPVQEIPIYAEQVVDDQAEVDITVFDDALSPHGNWLEVDGLRVWQPHVVVRDPLWRPYCDNGRWVYTDRGWTWNSGYAWGWAPFHYGRWRRHVRHGWLWHPGTMWAPAWVSWRCSERYYGWAPLPPAATVDVLVRTGTRGFGLHLGIHDYAFVDCRLFLTANLRRHCLGRTRAMGAYHTTRVVLDSHVFRGSTCFHRGPGRDRVVRATGREIPTLQLTSAPHRPGQTRGANRVRGTTLEVHRPRVVGSGLQRPAGTTAREARTSRIAMGTTRARIQGPAETAGTRAEARPTRATLAGRTSSPARRVIQPSREATPSRPSGGVAASGEASSPAARRAVATLRRDEETSLRIVADAHGSNAAGTRRVIRPRSVSRTERGDSTEATRAATLQTTLQKEEKPRAVLARQQVAEKAEQARAQRARLDRERRETAERARLEQQKRAEAERQAIARRQAAEQARAAEAQAAARRLQVERQARADQARAQRARLDRERLETAERARLEQQKRAEAERQAIARRQAAEQARAAEAQAAARRLQAERQAREAQERRARELEQARAEQARAQRARLDRERLETAERARLQQQKRAEAERQAIARRQAAEQARAAEAQAAARRLQAERQAREAQQRREATRRSQESRLHRSSSTPAPQVRTSTPRASTSRGARRAAHER